MLNSCSLLPSSSVPRVNINFWACTQYLYTHVGIGIRIDVQRKFLDTVSRSYVRTVTYQFKWGSPVNYRRLQKSCKVKTNCGTELQFCHCTRHEQGNGLLGKFFLSSSFFTAFKGKIYKEQSIAYDCFDTM